ncbi:integral membrane protein [marine actinobacterium PHSC20C1]|nr:integral membrane protein [marine actinobacterium PHSC20C1]
MVTGISGIMLSFVAFGFLPGVAAVVMGHMAQKKQPLARPFWLTGLITGYVSAAIGLITGIFIIGFFALIFAGFSEVGADYRGGF